MTRLNLLLLMALIASALVLVRASYDARRLFNENHRAESESLRLAGEHKRLEAERQLQATNLRVERTARERLKMSTATPAITMYERADGQAAPLSVPNPTSTRAAR